MSLHQLIPDNEIPEVLRRPLRFGDTAQIDALRVIDCRLEEMAATEKAIAEGKSVMWSVSIEITAEKTVEVYASSEEEAEKKAMDGFDKWDMDYDTSVYARRAKT